MRTFHGSDSPIFQGCQNAATSAPSTTITTPITPQHLGNKPNTLIALVMHDGLAAATGRTFSGAGAGAPPTRSSALALIVPAKERVARLEAEVAVVVRQVGSMHARMTRVNVCPVKSNVWRMSSARTSVGTSVAGGAGEGESVSRPVTRGQLTRSVPVPGADDVKRLPTVDIQLSSRAAWTADGQHYRLGIPSGSESTERTMWLRGCEWRASPVCVSQTLAIKSALPLTALEDTGGCVRGHYDLQPTPLSRSLSKFQEGIHSPSYHRATR